MDVWEVPCSSCSGLHRGFLMDVGPKRAGGVAESRRDGGAGRAEDRGRDQIKTTGHVGFGFAKIAAELHLPTTSHTAFPCGRSEIDPAAVVLLGGPTRPCYRRPTRH